MPLSDLNEGLRDRTSDRPPTWSFEKNGPGIEGTVVDGGKFQGTVYMSDPPIPQTWPNGDPKYTYYLVLQTGIIDPGTEDHDGRWTVTLNSNRYTAANDALKAAGCETRQFEQGGKFGLRFLGKRPNQKGTAEYNAYEAYYTPPPVVSGFGPHQDQPAPYGAPAPTPQQVAQQAQYAPQPAPAWGSQPQQAPQSPPAWPQPTNGQGAAPTPAQAPQEATPAQAPPAWPTPTPAA